ncbi:MAG: hypothetical protein ABIQ64_00490, partial [Candidatus Saccharimonadales bacterium]
SDGVVKVYSEIYQNGYTTRKEVTDPAFINEVIRTYLQMALRAGSVVKSRTPEVRAIADIDARNRYARREGMSTLESSYFAI